MKKETLRLRHDKTVNCVWHGFIKSRHIGDQLREMALCEAIFFEIFNLHFDEMFVEIAFGCRQFVNLGNKGKQLV